MMDQIFEELLKAQKAFIDAENNPQIKVRLNEIAILINQAFPHDIFLAGYKPEDIAEINIRSSGIQIKHWDYNYSFILIPNAYLIMSDENIINMLKNASPKDFYNTYKTT